MSVLYLVATPIGNLQDVTLRALGVLEEVHLIAAEDTRTTRKLMAAHGIHTRITSYYEGNKHTKTSQLLKALEKKDIALVSEAGTPGLSDPGYELVQGAIERNIPVVPIPGPSAVITALVISGLPTDQFVYLGFLPRRTGERQRFLERLAGETRTIIAFEAPRRLQKTLQDLLTFLGDRRLAACRELTKTFEEVFRGTVSQALDYFQEPKGEFTLVIAGASLSNPQFSHKEVHQRLLAMKQKDVPPSKAVSQVARELGMKRAQVYETWVAFQKGNP